LVDTFNAGVILMTTSCF